MAKLTKAEQQARTEPGGSNVGNYDKVKSFCGPAGGAPKGSFPVDSIERGKSAIKLAHNAPNPQGIKDCVYRHYPSLRQAQEGGAFGKPAYNNRGVRIPGMYTD